MKKPFFILLLLVIFAPLVFAEVGVKKKRPLPPEYGRVIINNYSQKAGIPPVAFDHWLHRAKFTCRLCHVDIGFGMKAGTTEIRETDNIAGYYCGTCHNGRTTINGKKVFEACSKTDVGDRSRCLRCHSLGQNVRPEYDFKIFTQDLPKERFGNGIDWEKAEHDKIISPIDSMEGVSIKRKPLTAQKDFLVVPTVEGMPDIIFSHQKHTVWNGCELCHPEIFGKVKRGQIKFTMNDNFEGKYCGVCHMTVAFPMIDCQRCHSKPV
ncbi:MAG TPA: c(7)-type cytochrome triheme domain-containing protein [Thermodesulfovibrionales bacterium]|nr:c(7)-type cytochrome triheme domain-containing protein [Thermodesulfovibrionales bacterium]